MQELLDHPALYALGNALMHSWWQFALIALSGGFAARFYPSPACRHRIYLLGMSACGLAFVVTALCYYPINAASTQVSLSELNWPMGQDGRSGTHEVATFNFSAALRVGALGYLLSLFALLIRTSGDLWTSRTMRRKSTVAPEALLTTFEGLKQRCGLNRPLTLNTSNRIASALTVGVLRPMVIVPLSLLHQLDPPEMEAVLLHEIAHVVRKDHLWNALQIALKTLFFYHPLIHWLSRQVDLQREYACDDLVTGRIDRQLYAQSLLKVARFSIAHKNQFVMQAQGKSAFTHRIHRLFQTPGKVRTLTLNRWLLLPLLLLPLMMTVSLTAQQDEPAATIQVMPTTDASETILYFLDGRRYETMDQLKKKLGQDAYLQMCGAEDEELRRINAREKKNFTTIMRYYNRGVPVGGEQSGTFQRLPVTEPQAPARATYYNGEQLEASGESAMVTAIMADNESKAGGLHLAQFIDDVPVHGKLDANDGFSVTGSVVHYYDADAEETKSLNQSQGSHYDGVVKLRTAPENEVVTKNAASAIQTNDSILYIVNEVPYDELDINKIPPEAIAMINVRKRVNYPPGALDKKYKGVIEIVLKPGYELEELLAVPSTTTGDTDSGREKAMQDMFGADRRFDNTAFFLDGKRVKYVDIQSLKANGIDSIEVIKDKKTLRKMGLRQYEAAIKINTLQGDQ